MQALLDRNAALEASNRELRAKLCEPETVRFLKSLALQKLQAFVESSVETVPQALSGDVQAAVTAVSEITEKYQTLDSAYQAIHNDVIAPLRQVNDTLKTRCEELELQNLLHKDAEATEVQEMASLLKTLQNSEATLISTLKEVQSEQGVLSLANTESLQHMRSAMQAVEQSASQFGKLEGQLTQQKAEQEAAISSMTFSLQRRVEELQREVSNRDEMIARLTTSIQESLQENLRLRETVTLTESKANELQAQLTAATNSEKSEEQLITVEQRKRRRLEMERIEEGSSRAEMISFWYEGHDKLIQLEETQAELHAARQELAHVTEQAAQLASRRSSAVESITVLTREVDRLQKDAVGLRQQNRGLESEVETLISHLSKMVAREIDQTEVRKCAEAIRQSAVRAAEANALSVVDHTAVEAALRRAQDLRQEISQLSKQREKLQRIVHLREQRLRALNSACKTMFASQLASSDASSKLPSSSSITAAEVPSPLVPRLTSILQQILDLPLDTDDSDLRNAAIRTLDACSASVISFHPSQDRLDNNVLRAENETLKTELKRCQSSLLEAVESQKKLQEASLQQMSHIAGAIARAQTETEQLRLTAAAARELSARACDVAVSSMQFCVSQVDRLQALYTEKDSERKQMAQLKLQLRQANRATESRMDVVEQRLSDQLVFLKETAEEEKRRHALREVQYVTAYAEDVKVQVRALLEARDQYLEGTKKQPAALAAMLAELKSQWAAAQQKQALQKSLVTDAVVATSNVVADAVTKAVSGHYATLSVETKKKNDAPQSTTIGSAEDEETQKTENQCLEKIEAEVEGMVSKI